MAANTLTVGNVQIVAIHDNEGALPLSMTFPNVPAEAWAQYQQKYPEGFSGAENLRVHFDCYIVRSQGRTILVDTGGGSMATNPGTVGNLIGGVDGRLTSELRSAGVGLEDVDTVFLTHLHPDHVGWNVSSGGSGPAPTFPNARYVFGQADWEAFRSPKDEELFGFTFWRETLAPLESAGVIDPIPGERALTTEVTAVPTPGHTPGSMSLAVVSQGQRAFILGDVFHGPAQVTEPDWVFSFDMDAALAVRTRKQMLDQAESEDAVMAICHHTGFGKVVRTEGQRYWQGV
jgi:glyoxylase-like metal-dependent hydrolase (beta-lactamase superfamily II)